MITKLFTMLRAPIFSNVAEGTHAGQLTRTLESAAGTRHLLGKPGSSTSEIQLCGTSDLPLGVITDEGVPGDLVNVALPGSASSTVLMVASEPIAVGAAVYTAAGGKVQDEPAVAGIYYQVGTAVSPASGDGEVLEVDPVAPRKTVVLAAFSGTAGADIAALGTALEEAPDKVIVLES